MKIAPLPASGPSFGASGATAPEGPNVRALRMSTNATPGAGEAQVEELPGTTLSTEHNSEVAAEETQPLSPQYAALAKQRRALQQERQAFEREKAEQAKAGTQPGGVTLADLKTDPLGKLLEAGVTFDQLTQAVLAHQDGVNPKVQALEAKLKALEEGVDKKLTERDTQAKQAALTEMKREASTLSAQGEEYALVRETRSIPKVMQLIEKTYDTTGEVLEVREALRLVEDELFNDSLKLARLDKVQAKLTPTAPALQPQQRQMRTLTNRDTASVPMSAKARAIAAFHGTLKK